MDAARPIVIDVGSSAIKFGIAGEASPLVEFPAAVGRIPSESIEEMRDDRRYRLARGFFESWDDRIAECWSVKYGYWAGKWKDRGMVRETLRHDFEVCGVDPTEGTIIISEPVGTSKEDRKWMIECMFGSFRVSRLCIVPQPTLALYSTCRTTGFVIESGHGLTQFSPIYEGCPLEPGSVSIRFGGYNVTKTLVEMLEKEELYHRGPDVRPHYVIDKRADQIKAKSAYVAKDSGEKPENSEITFPDGYVLTLESEKVTRCTEILFDPKLAGKDFEGVDKIAFDTIEKCSSELRRDLWSNFVVSGGNTMLKGFCERLESSLRRRSDTPDDIHIICPDDRVKSVWRGGSLLATSPHFDQMCVTREYFNECGASTAARAFF